MHLIKLHYIIQLKALHWYQVTNIMATEWNITKRKRQRKNTDLAFSKSIKDGTARVSLGVD